MTTETLLTDEQIAKALNDFGAIDYADVPLSYDLEIARAIEQAALQSQEREDNLANAAKALSNVFWSHPLDYDKLHACVVRLDHARRIEGGGE